MDLEARLRAFAAFVRRGSFSGAAEELRISQPAVSKHIGCMEREFGIELIERHSRSLTPAGELVASHVLRAQAILAQAARGITAMRKPGAGTLLIMASGTPGTYLLPNAIFGFQAAYPGVRVTFTLGTSAEVVDAVRCQRAEIGIAGGFLAAPEIEAEPLIEDEIVIVGPPAFRNTRLSRDELESMTWISREDGSATSALADNALADLGVIPKKRLALPAWESIKLAVRHGHGIAAFSRLALSEELATGTLVVIPCVPWKVRRMFSIIRIRDAALTPQARDFLELMRLQLGPKALPSRRSRHRAP